MDHSYAYVGPDLQDTYGIDPASFANATSLRDSYFLGGTASQMMSRLQQTPDGIMVSLETINDYSLKQGDLLKLRVLNQRTGHFHVVPFHVVGTVQEFPSAPARLVHGRQPELSAVGEPRSGPQRRLREDQRRPARRRPAGRCGNPRIRGAGTEPQ